MPRQFSRSGGLFPKGGSTNARRTGGAREGVVDPCSRESCLVWVKMYAPTMGSTSRSGTVLMARIRSPRYKFWTRRTGRGSDAWCAGRWTGCRDGVRIPVGRRDTRPRPSSASRIPKHLLGGRVARGRRGRVRARGTDGRGCAADRRCACRAGPEACAALAATSSMGRLGPAIPAAGHSDGCAATNSASPVWTKSAKLETRSVAACTGKAGSVLMSLS